MLQRTFVEIKQYFNRVQRSIMKAIKSLVFLVYKLQT